MASRSKKVFSDVTRRRKYLKELLSIFLRSEDMVAAWEKWIDESADFPPNLPSKPFCPYIDDLLLKADRTKIETQEQWDRRREEIRAMIRDYARVGNWERWVKESGELPPNFAKITPCPDLPDPFVMNDGTKVVTREQWDKRREEIKEIIQHYAIGHMPPPPTGEMKVTELKSEDVFDGRCTYKLVKLNFGPDLAVTLHVRLVIPKRADGPFPVILSPTWKEHSPAESEEFRIIGSVHNPPIARDLVGAERGYVCAAYKRNDCALDCWGNDSSGFAPHYPGYDWRTIARWAWGMHRCVDYLRTLDFIDKDKIAVTGISRNGKTALVAAAFDERIAAAIPHNSGAGGTSPYRFIGESTCGESLDLTWCYQPH